MDGDGIAIDDEAFVEQELGQNCMDMNFVNAFHQDARKDSFEY